MQNIRELLVERLSEYLKTAEDWDAYEILEWAFGHDDHMIEEFRDFIDKKQRDDRPQ